MSYITTEHLNIYFEEKGDGAPVLFISGTGGDLRQRPNVLDGPLPKHRRVIAYDQRGLGRTEKPDRPYTMGEYGDDAAALLAALGIEQVDVIGVSFGGMVAQHFAIRHPSNDAAAGFRQAPLGLALKPSALPTHRKAHSMDTSTAECPARPATADHQHLLRT